ncbi:MAG: hypothetical protein AABX17_03145 [Nanoarchaeota archaeon]
MAGTRLTYKCDKEDHRKELSLELRERLIKKGLNSKAYCLCDHTRGIECVNYDDVLRLRTAGLCTLGL